MAAANSIFFSTNLHTYWICQHFVDQKPHDTTFSSTCDFYYLVISSFYILFDCYLVLPSIPNNSNSNFIVCPPDQFRILGEFTDSKIDNCFSNEVYFWIFLIHFWVIAIISSYFILIMQFLGALIFRGKVGCF